MNTNQNMDQDQGTCNICDNSFSTRGLTRHLTGCMKSNLLEGDSSEVYLVKIDGGGQFWIYVAIDQAATLDDLDNFLRRLWVECCGHLSSFRINDTRYDKSPPSGHPVTSGDKTMDITIEKVLDQNTSFEYTYDWGSSTILDLDVKAIQQGTLEDDITLLARNPKPFIACFICEDRQSTQICSQCVFETDDYIFCDKCSKQHECDDYMYLPYVNSPRTGICAYGDDMR